MRLPKRISSDEVNEHIAFLRATFGDMARFTHLCDRLTNDLSATNNELARGALNDELVSTVVSTLSTALIPRRIQWLGAWGEYASRVQQLARAGETIGQTLHGLEGQRRLATDLLEQASRRYHEEAVIDGSDPVSDVLAAGERLLNEKLAKAMDDMRAAEHTLQRIETMIEEATTTWFLLVEHLLDLPDPSHAKTIQEKVDDGAKTRVLDISRDWRGRYRPPWRTDENGRTTIDIDDVVQGALGDCYFVAPVAGLASIPGGAAHLARLIKETGNGTFIVTFPGYPPIVVDAEFTQLRDGGGWKSETAQDRGDDYWFLILEKAFAMLKGGYGAAEGGYDPSGKPIGGAAEYSMGLLGLRVSNWFRSTSNPAELTDVLKRVTGGSAVAVADFDLWTVFARRPGRPAQSFHSVTVLRIEQGPPPSVVMRNPWGHNNGLTVLEKYKDKIHTQNDGTIRMDLDVFERECVEVAVGELP